MIAVKYDRNAISVDELVSMIKDIREAVNAKRPDEIVIAIPNKIDADFDYSIQELKQLRNYIDYIIEQRGE